MSKVMFIPLPCQFDERTIEQIKECGECEQRKQQLQSINMEEECEDCEPKYYTQIVYFPFNKNETTIDEFYELNGKLVIRHDGYLHQHQMSLSQFLELMKNHIEILKDVEKESIITE